MNDDTRRPASEIDEPVFSSDDQDSVENGTESASDIDSSTVINSEPNYSPETETELPAETAAAAPDLEEPVFSPGGESGVWQDSDPPHETPEATEAVPEWEFPTADPVGVEEYSGLSVGNQAEEPGFGSQAMATDSSWANVAPDSETMEEPRPATEYNFFDETPALEVATAPPPTRKLGRTGPVWVLGGIALVLIAGLVWLGISRLTASSESSTTAPSEPTVQQVAADAPTPEPPTSTPGPTPTPTPILLPLNANVKVANTEGQGVQLRAEPGKAGIYITTIEEGKTMVVLEADSETDQSAYPVPLDGFLWYRMRVPGVTDEKGNPLVGWSASNFFVVEVP